MLTVLTAFLNGQHLHHLHWLLSVAEEDTVQMRFSFTALIGTGKYTILCSTMKPLTNLRPPLPVVLLPVPVAAVLIQFLANELGKAQRMTQVFGHLYLGGRPG